MSFEAEWIDSEKRWEECSSDWDDAVTDSSEANIFSTWDYLHTSWRHFAKPDGDCLAILAVRERNRLVGFAPMRICFRRRLGFTIRRLMVLPAWASDRVLLVEPSSRRHEFYGLLISQLEQRMDSWDVLEFPAYPADGGLLHALQTWNAQRRDLSVKIQKSSPSPFIRLPARRDMLLSTLSKNLRKNLKRHRRKLEATGELKLAVFTRPDEISQAVDRYAEIESNSWKVQAQQGISKNAKNLCFYRDLLVRLSRQGRSVVHFLEKDGRYLAGNIDVRYGDVVYSLQTAYDDAYKAYSPGNVLMQLALEWHIDHGATRYELFSHCLENKILWTEDHHQNVRLAVVQRRRVRHFLTFRDAWIPQRTPARVDPFAVDGHVGAPTRETV